MSSIRVVFGVLLCTLFFSSGVALAHAGGAAGAESAANMKKLNQQLYVGHDKAPALPKSTQTQ